MLCPLLSSPLKWTLSGREWAAWKAFPARGWQLGRNRGRRGAHQARSRKLEQAVSRSDSLAGWHRANRPDSIHPSHIAPPLRFACPFSDYNRRVPAGRKYLALTDKDGIRPPDFPAKRRGVGRPFRCVSEQFVVPALRDGRATPRGRRPPPSVGSSCGVRLGDDGRAKLQAPVQGSCLASSDADMAGGGETNGRGFKG